MEERNYWLAFSLFPGIGPKRFAQLLSHFDSAEIAWQASEKDLREAGLGEKTTQQLLVFRQTFSFEKALEKLREKQVFFVCLSEETYPPLLRKLENPPFILYYKGNISLVHYLPTVGIVGTRKITSYGEQVTRMLTSDLVTSGFCIVSGLAMGVDAIAHQTTLDTHGKTIAVLGCGVDCCNPSSNQKLYDQIIAHDGLIVSEFPVGMSPSTGSFPSRNRIIAGLSQAVLVTEGAEDSGALITAEDALKIGRNVFAVPGPITSSLSKGPNNLISKGARLITNAEEISKELGITNNGLRTNREKKVLKGANEEEQQIIDSLQNESLSFDEIVKKTNMPASITSSLLSMLELKGFVSTDAVGNYQLM